MKKVIILGAGKPYAGSAPTVFFKQNKYFNNFDVIKNILSRYSKDISLITGYNNRKIKENIKTNIVYNPKWSKTKSLYSLLLAEFEKYDELIIAYSDIIFNENILSDLIKSKKELSIIISTKDINFKKGKEYLKVKKKKIEKIGSNLKKYEVNAEFIGLIKIKKKTISFLNKIKKNKKKFNNLQISDLVNLLLKNNYNYKIIDIKNDWIEIKNDTDKVRKHILSTKANTLDFAKKYLKKSIILPQITFSVNSWKKNEKKIVKDIKTFSDKIIIRSSSLDEDNFETSGAGKFVSFSNVTTKYRFNSKIDKVISSFKSKNLKNQILIQPSAKDIICNGVVFTNDLDNDFPAYIINLDFKKNNTSSITSGTSEKHKTFTVSKHNLKINDISNQYIKKIILASKEIEDLFLQESLDIEFGINKKKQFILFQVRPIIKNNKKKINPKFYKKTYESNFKKWDKNYKNLKHKNYLTPLLGLMPDWNPAEIIGFKPKILSSSMYEEVITNKIWAKQRDEFGYKIIKNSKLLLNFFGTLYVNVNKTFNSFIPKKIDNILEKKLLQFYNTLLINNKQLHDKIEFAIVPTCLTSNFKNLRKKLRYNKFSNKEINRLEIELRSINFNTKKIFNQNLDRIKRLQSNYSNIVNQKISDIDLIKKLIQECKKNGTLPFAHFARIAFISIAILKDANRNNIISKNSLDQFLNNLNTINKIMTKDAVLYTKKKIDKKFFFEKYRHLRPGTYDISTENYGENNFKILKDIAKSSKKLNKTNLDSWNNEKFFLFKYLTKNKIINFKNINEFENFLYCSIEQRELSKFYFTRYINRILELITKLALKNDISRENVNYLNLSEILSLNKISRKQIMKKIEIRKLQYEIDKNFNLPHVISSKKQFLNFEQLEDIPNFVGRKKIIQNIKYVKSFDLDSKDLKNKIALIESADPGYDWIFSKKIAGLITMFGGANSHMAIRSSELNLPAAIGVGNLKFSELKKASLVKLDSNNKILEIIK